MSFEIACQTFTEMRTKISVNPLPPKANGSFSQLGK